MGSFLSGEKIFAIVLLLFYLFTFSAYLIDVKTEIPRLTKIKRVAIFITLLFHLIFIFYVFTNRNHIPLTNKGELFSVVAFSVTLIYFILELLTEIHGTGFLILFFSLLFQVLSLLFLSPVQTPPSEIINSYIGIHIYTAILGYVGFAISAAYGLMYIVLVSKLKKNRFDIFFNKLPNLEILSKLSSTAFYTGFVMLTTALILGIIWLPRIFPERGFFDPKVIATLLVWLVYAIGALLNLLKIIHGKKFVYLSLTAFGFLIAASAVTTLLTSSFHSF